MNRDRLIEFKKSKKEHCQPQSENHAAARNVMFGMFYQQLYGPI